MRSRQITRRHWLVAGPGALAALHRGAAAADGPVRLGIDAEFGHATSTSAEAIRRGAQIAVDEVNAAGGVLGGRKLELVQRDNRGVPARAMQNFRELAALPDLVAVLTGKFSPSVLECLPLAHELKVPLLAAWSAADGIVDHGQTPNYVFRLSLRDEWAIGAMLGHAQRRLGARRVALLLPNTAWGRSSLAAAERRLAAAGAPKLVHTAWYNWSDPSLVAHHQVARQAGAQAVLMVANEAEGAVLVNEVANLPSTERLPLVSHWGVTGGRFHAMASPALASVDFSVVQTYSFIGARDPVALRVLAALKRQYGINDARQIESPVGVAHAYDLTTLLAKAVQAAGRTERPAVRDALESLPPHQGLLRRYAPAFTLSRHEALEPAQVYMAAYERDGALVRIGQD